MAIKHVVRCDGDECDREPPVSEQPTPYAPDTVTTDPPEWMAEWQAYVADLDTSLEGQDEHLIHQDGFAAGWTLGTERSEDTVAALRARLEAAEQERDEWARVAVGADHDRAGEYGERLEAEARLAAAEARSVRLAEALQDELRNATAEIEQRFDYYVEHSRRVQRIRAALAEHDAAAKGKG